METLNIGDNINLHIIDTKKFKTATMLVLFRQPLTREKATRTSLISNILKSGSQRYSSVSELYKVVDLMYGSVFESQIVKKGEEQILQLYIDMLNGHGLFEQGVDFLKEIMFNPLLENPDADRKEFNEAVVSKEKKNLKRVIEGRKNNRTEYAKLRCIECMCDDEPFGVYGDGYAEDLNQIGGGNLYTEYEKIIKSSPVEVMLICDRSSNNIDAVQGLFEGVCREGTVRLTKPEYTKPVSDVKRISEEADTSQGKLCLGYRAQVNPSGELIYPLIVANEILGGGSNSKLFKTIREDKSLCYYINSSLYRFKSVILVQTGVERDNFDKVTDLTEKCMDELRNGLISEDELSNAKKTLRSMFTGIEDHPSAIADFYLTRYMMSDTENVLEKIEAVDAKSVRDACEKIMLDTVYTLS